MINKISLYDKILSPLVTEKSTNMSEHNKVIFKVPNGANKKVPDLDIDDFVSRL